MSGHLSIQHTQTHLANISSKSITIYGQSINICVTFCFICDDVLMCYGKVYMGKFTEIWALKTKIYKVGLRRLNAKGLIFFK